MPLGFCRDCLADAAPQAARCPACGSPRLIRHDELATLSIAHVDCDAFYATIEKRDDPALAAEPVIVGGGRRGVVAAACYVARTYGIRSAMPMYEALRLCPHAKVVRPNMEKYSKAGREVRAMMLALTPLVEPLSIDEAFLDLSGTERLHGMWPAKALARFAAEVEKTLRITVSIGLACNKFLAKIASDLDKPRGFAVLGGSEAAAFLAPKPVSFIYGVGKASMARLARDGFHRIADLQRVSEIELYRRYGEEGRRLARLARGLDERTVSADRETKSVSSETTFERDLSDFRALEKILWGLTEEVSARLKAKELAGATVTLKLKTADFKIRTRARSLDSPTQLAGRIFAAARDLLKREADGTRFRLIGVGSSALVTSDQADPADLVDGRAAIAEHAVDRVRARFGDDAVIRGLAFERPEDLRARFSLALPDILRSGRRAPDVGRQRAPDLGHLRMIAVPRPRLEIAEIFIQHFVELGEHLDDLVIGVAVIGINIVAGAVTAGTPDDRNFFAAEEVARRLHLRPVLQLESDVVHLRALAAHEIDGVVVRPAAHEDEPVLDPVRHAKSENLAVEVGILFRLRDDESQMAELDRSNAGDRLRSANRRLGGEKLADGALGILECKHLRNARRRIVA